MHDLDVSFSPSDDDDVFNINEREDQRDNSTETTESDDDDLNLDSDSGCEDFDVDEQVPLYGGNVHPLDYYRQEISKLALQSGLFPGVHEPRVALRHNTTSSSMN